MYPEITILTANKRYHRLALLLVILKLLAILLFLPAQLFAVNNCQTGKTGGFISGNVSFGSSINWATPNNSLASDDAYSRTSIKSPQITKYLRDRDFHFSVPSYATISGLIVYIEKKQDAGANIRDNSIRIEMNDVPVGNDKANQSVVWSTTDSIYVYGSWVDMWGLSLTPADVNGSTFGVLTAAYIPAGGDTVNTYYAYIDNVMIDVYFTVPDDSSCGGYSLPISATEFKARVVEYSKVKLSWLTYSETNVSYFSVERSYDGEHFENVAKVKAAGNSSVLQSYEAMDEHRVNRIYYYRLRAVDFNGNTTVATRVISVQPEKNSNSENVLNVFPNPSTGDRFNFSVPVSEGEEISIVIIDQKGEKLLEQKITAQSTEVLNGTIMFVQKPVAGLYRVQCTSNHSFYSCHLLMHD